METKPVRGRFAPSPSGRMHLGNIFCAPHGLAAGAGPLGARWFCALRIWTRTAPGWPYAAQMEDDLTWFGMDWDEGGSKGGPQGPYYQSQRTQRYRRYFEELRAKGLVYPCYCTRGELHASPGSSPGGWRAHLFGPVPLPNGRRAGPAGPEPPPCLPPDGARPGNRLYRWLSGGIPGKPSPGLRGFYHPAL